MNILFYLDHLNLLAQRVHFPYKTHITFHYLAITLRLVLISVNSIQPKAYLITFLTYCYRQYDPMK